MFRCKNTIILILILILFAPAGALAQVDCPTPTQIYIGAGPVLPCQLQETIIPIYMNNPCAIGGFEIHIAPADHNWIWFPSDDIIVADTTGGRLSDWELFIDIVNADSSEISLLGIADLPGGDSDVHLPPGDGLLFNLRLRSIVYTQSDTVLPVLITFANLSDTSGYILFDWQSTPGGVDVGPAICDSNPRGDCNCDGARNGIDVVYLVNYLKGIGSLTICGGCGGDTNNSGSVNGLDVTFIVNYLKGIGPIPLPCD